MNKQIIRNFDEFINEEENFELDQELDQEFDNYDEFDGDFSDELDEEFGYEDEFEYDEELAEAEDYFDYYSDLEVMNEDKKLWKKAAMMKKKNPAAAAEQVALNKYCGALANMILSAKDDNAARAILQKPISGAGLGDRFKGKKNSDLLPKISMRFMQLTAANNRGKLDAGSYKKTFGGLQKLGMGKFQAVGKLIQKGKEFIKQKGKEFIKSKM